MLFQLRFYLPEKFPIFLYQIKLKDRLIWVDCEMTGLEVETDALIEIAVVVTEVKTATCPIWHRNAMTRFCTQMILWFLG